MYFVCFVVTPPMKKIAILNGPNLNRLGRREPEIYGTATLKDLEKLVRGEAKKLGVSVKFFQSNHEGVLVDMVHAFADFGTEGFIVNFAAYSHTSIALHDALKSTGLPAIEVHISDISRRVHRHDLRAGLPRLRRGPAAAGQTLTHGPVSA